MTRREALTQWLADAEQILATAPAPTPSGNFNSERAANVPDTNDIASWQY